MVNTGTGTSDTRSTVQVVITEDDDGNDGEGVEEAVDIVCAGCGRFLCSVSLIVVRVPR